MFESVRRITDRNIWVIYAAILLLGVAYGTSIAVLSIHLEAHGISELAMGGLATAFALGIVSLSSPAGLSIKRFGAKKTLLVALLGYAVCVACFPFMKTLTGLSIARFFDGAFSVVVWVSAETALLSRSERENKGLIMSLYAISLAIGYVAGPVLSHFVVPVFGTSATFIIAGGLATVAALIVLTKFESGKGEVAAEEEVTAPSTTSLATIIWRIKTSVLATFAYGYFQASVVIYLPLFLIRTKNVPKGDTILITAFFAGGMLLMSGVSGRLGDRFGHLLVMRVLATLGAAMTASFVLLPSFAFMCGAVFIAGATLAAISPVSLALQGVVTPKPDLNRANAFYNAMYAVGMLVGPPVSGVLYTRWGGGMMLYHLAGLWMVFVLFSVVFAGDDPRARPAARRQLIA